MNKWFQHIIEGSTYQGLEIFELGDQVSFALLKVKKKKGELHTVLESIYNSMDEASKEITKNNLLFLTVNTSKVLYKHVDSDVSSNPEQMVIQAFPNLELENFYYQSQEASSANIVSICKKDYLKQLLGSLSNLGIFPTQIQLGIAPVFHIIDYLDKPITTGSNFKLTKDGKVETTHGILTEKMEISGLSIAPTSLVSFAHIVGHLSKTGIKGNLVDSNAILKNEFKNHRVFNLGLRMALGMFLGILLVNFLFFSNYQKKIQSLEMNYALEHEQVNSLDALEKRVALKEKRLEAITGAANSKSSFFLDRIAIQLPNSVQLDQMVYQPVLKPVRELKTIELDKNKFLISGIVQNKIEFTQWAESLEQQDWVEHIEIIIYEYVSKSKDKFTINVYLDETE